MRYHTVEAPSIILSTPATPEVRRQPLKIALPAIALIILSLFPYLNKAFTIDDPFFVLEAHQILKTPLQPMSFPLCWMDEVLCVARAGQYSTLQGLMGYVLVPMAVGGGAEWIAHVIQILFSCVAVIAMGQLALRIGLTVRQAAISGVLLVVTPPFLPMASTAMPDIVALTLGLAGLERLLAWKYEDGLRNAVIGTIALGLAPYARPQLVGLIPLTAFWLAAGWQTDLGISPQLRRLARLWTPLMAALILLVALNVITRDRGPGDAVDLHIRAANIPKNISDYFLYLCFPIPLALTWCAIQWRKLPVLYLFPLIPVLVLHFTFFPSRSLLLEWPVAASSYGMAALCHIAYTSFQRRDMTGFLLLLWILVPLPAVIYHHFPIKYLLPSMPAVVLLIQRSMATLQPRTERIAGWAMAAFLTAYSGVILRADNDLAEYGRRAVAELVTPHVKAGERVWYGGQWGFYYYAQEAGATFVNPRGPKPRPGDLLVIPWMEGGVSVRDRLPNRELITTLSFDAPHGRTMGYGGGLYSNIGGKVLWIWKPHDLNVYQLYRMR